MNRSKKLAITLAVFAVLGGSSYIQPEQALAANVVIDGDMEFETLKSNDDWTYSVSTDGAEHAIYLKNSNNNTVTFQNIKTDANGKEVIDIDISGGRGSDEASYNKIYVINSIVGSEASVFGGYSYWKDTNYNKVVIKDSVINEAVYGGDSHHGNAIGNRVIISNSEINGDIYGGYAYVPTGEAKPGEISGSAENNTIIIRDNTKLDRAKIYGGYVSITDAMDDNIPPEDKFTEDMFKKVNNTLVLDDWSGSVVRVRSCDNINFNNINLSNFVNKGDEKAILTITGDDANKDSFKNIIGSDLDDKTQFGTKDINIGLSFKGGQDINADETIRLVQMTGKDAIVDEDKGAKIKLANDGTAYAGVAQVIKGELVFDKLDDGDSTQNKYLDYKITSVGLNDQVNVVNEGRAASAAFLNQSDELISEALAGLNLEDKYGFETFAMVYGNDSRYGTNSDLSINGWSGLVGVGSNNKTKAGDFAWAAFFENGAGNYDISTTMNGITMEGDGSTVYNGGGIAARLTGENGVYGEASLRAGLLKNDLEHGLQNQNGEAFGYESESNYYGMHIGIGKIFKLENGASVDTYAKYYHSTVKDDSFTIDGDEFEMDDINSDRLRLGIRYNQGMDRTFNVYYGAAWEYEFNGESNGYAQGHKMEETSLKGSTVIGELGVVIQPENSPWSFDAKVKGYGGQRDGYSGSILATYHF